jgi:hypothetical protein
VERGQEEVAKYKYRTGIKLDQPQVRRFPTRDSVVASQRFARESKGGEGGVSGLFIATLGMEGNLGFRGVARDRRPGRAPCGGRSPAPRGRR